MTTTAAAETVDQEHADQARLSTLAAQSERDDTVLIEMVYRTHWVRFDVSVMEMQYLSAADLVTRHLLPALRALQITERAAEADPASS